MKSRARLNPSHDERTRAKIKTSYIINRLHSFVKGDVEMAPHQVTAALGLLRKTLPDLSATELTGDITHSYALVLDQSETAEAWEQQLPANIN